MRASKSESIRRADPSIGACVCSSACSRPAPGRGQGHRPDLRQQREDRTTSSCSIPRRYRWSRTSRRRAARATCISMPTTRKLYVACGDDDVIDIIDVAKLEVIGKLTTGPSPETFAIDETAAAHLRVERGGVVALHHRHRPEHHRAGGADRRRARGRAASARTARPSMSPPRSAISCTRSTPTGGRVTQRRGGRHAAAPFRGDARRQGALGHDASCRARSTSSTAPSSTVAGKIEFLPPGMRKTDVTPVGLAMTKDGKTAYVTLGHAAHVAVVDVRDAQDPGLHPGRQARLGHHAVARREARSTSPTASATTSPSSTRRAARRRSRFRSAACPGAWSIDE